METRDPVDYLPPAQAAELERRQRAAIDESAAKFGTTPESDPWIAIRVSQRSGMQQLVRDVERGLVLPPADRVAAMNTIREIAKDGAGRVALRARITLARLKQLGIE